jgi:hypothetical protein
VRLASSILYGPPRIVLNLFGKRPGTGQTLDAHERYRQICCVVQQDRSALKGPWESVVPAG